MAERCEECGFEWEMPVLDSLRVIESLPVEARELVQAHGEEVHARPSPDVWSANEYIWHTADIFHISAEWIHEVRTLNHPTHYAVDGNVLADLRGYGRLPVETGLWSLERACDLFVREAAVTDPARTCYYHDWQDVTAEQVVAFLTHEAVHHLFDVRRALEQQEMSHVQ